jgi:hypothetical protein
MILSKFEFLRNLKRWNTLHIKLNKQLDPFTDLLGISYDVEFIDVILQASEFYLEFLSNIIKDDDLIYEAIFTGEPNEFGQFKTPLKWDDIYFNSLEDVVDYIYKLKGE